MIDKIRRLVGPLAKGKCPMTDDPDFMPCDYAAGNIDDAFELGRDCGVVDFARQIVKLLNEGA